MVHLVIQVSICVLVFTIFTGYGECVRTSKKIYITLDHVRGCFRRLNATHQIGCSSKIGGNIGVVHYVETDADLDWIINVGPHAPYMPLMSSLNFNITNVRRLRDSGKVSGILVSHVVANRSLTPVPPEGESPAHKCPLSEFGMYSNNSELGHCKKVTWNPLGTSFMYEDFGIPIFVVLNETEVNHIIYDCYEKFNKPNPNGTAKTFPLCSAELKSAMAATTDSVTCIRRTKHVVNLSANQFCDPLGDKNIIATVKETSDIETLPPDTVILVAARMDSFTMFDQVSPSANNDITGIVTLLAAAQALGEAGLLKNIRNDTAAKDILFTFFQGEAFDYIGSSRMVYEMEKKRFPTAKPEDEEDDNIRLHPIGLEHLSHLVEVSQLGGEDVWIHSDPLSRNISHIDAEVNEMIDSLKRIGAEHSVQASAAGAGQPLPPSSLHRFLRKRSLPAVLLTDHQAQFTNRFYQSRFDLPREINATYPDHVNRSSRYDYVTAQASRLAERSAMLAQFIYSLSTGDDVNVTVSETLVANLLYCFLYNGSCELYKTVVTAKDEKKLTNSSYPFYVSVARETNPVSTLTRKMLAYFIGDRLDVSDSADCKGGDKDKMYQYIWMQGPLGDDGKRHGLCVKSTATLTEAKSPIFLDEMEGYDWSSGEFSSWTESTWDDFSVRLFLVPSQQFQTATLSSGVIVLLVSMVLVYFVNSNANIIFSSNGPRTFY